ncbi:uncharacterized protein LOC141706492 [Apium graveolens]|uniref:uncharacterized protein LOC141706492 n=1 Tax=Apium graveolens TaxID=4045 RepID=UPI003D79F25E
MVPFEALYGRKCRTPICWNEVGEKLLKGPDLVQVTIDKISVARERLEQARSRQKSYADKGRREYEFKAGDKVFLKVSPQRGIQRFGQKGKLSPRYIEILERVGAVAYKVALPPQLSRVHNVFHASVMRKYVYHPNHVVQYPLYAFREDLSCEEEDGAILAREERVLRRNTIPFVKVLWKNHDVQEATGETEDSVRARYPYLFESQGGAEQDLYLGGRMSQYHDGSFYDRSSEEDSDHGYEYEPYVPPMTDHPTPDVGGQPPVLISNTDLLE